MVYRDLAASLAVVGVFLVAVVVVVCSSGGKKSDNPDPTPANFTLVHMRST